MAVRVSTGRSGKEVERHKRKAQNTPAPVEKGALSASIEATHLESNIKKGIARSIPASGPAPCPAAVTAGGMTTAGRAWTLSDSVRRRAAMLPMTDAMEAVSPTHRVRL